MCAGVIGLGDMGSGLPTILIANGFEVTAFDLSKTRMAPIRDVEGTSTGCVAEVANRSDVVHVMVMDGNQAKLANPGDAGSRIWTMQKNQAISLDLAEELEVQMQMASKEMQIFQAGQSKCLQGNNLACRRVTNETVCTELHWEGAQ